MSDLDSGLGYRLYALALSDLFLRGMPTVPRPTTTIVLLATLMSAVALQAEEVTPARWQPGHDRPLSETDASQSSASQAVVYIDFTPGQEVDPAAVQIAQLPPPVSPATTALPAYSPYATPGAPVTTAPPTFDPYARPAAPRGPVWPVRSGAADVPARAGGGFLGGDDVGLSDGFTWFQGFAPIYQSPRQVVLFGDGRALYYNDDGNQYGLNAALGYRVYDAAADRIWGGYAGYDHRRNDIFDFGQISAGLETLGKIFDSRINGYVIVTDDEAVAAVTDLHYEDHHILMDASLLSAMSGFDAEFGVNLTPQTPTVDVRAFAGFYGFFDDSTNDAWGVRGRLEARLWNRVAIEGSLQHDEVFDTSAFVSLSILFGGSSSAGTGTIPIVADRLGDPLEKNMHVVVRERSVNDVTAINPRTSAAWEVLHIDSNAAAGGTGTYEQPLNGLVDPAAQFDIALVHADSSFHNESITLGFDYQRLLGDGAAAPHTFASQFGTLTLPRANMLIPQPNIDAALGDAVTIADGLTGAEVSGLEITNAIEDGIGGRDLVDFDINRNSISGSGQRGVVLMDANSGTLSGNTATGNTDYGLVIETLSGGTVSGNTATGNGSDGLAVGTLSGGTVSGNTATGNTNFGLVIYDVSGGSVSGNTAVGNDYGIGIGSLSGGSVSGNTATGNTNYGFYVASFAGGSMSGNTATSNTSNGFNIDILSGGSLSDNTATDNNAGFYFTTLSGGTVSGNTATSNSNEGFNINTLSGGTVTGNTTTDHFIAGFYVGDFAGGSLSGNTADNNPQRGFWLNNPTDGMFNDNIATDNGFGYEIGGVAAAPFSAANNTGSGNAANDTYQFP